LLLVDGLKIENDNSASIIVEVDYEEKNDFTGLFVKLKQAYSDYSISVREYTANSSTTGAYTNAYKSKTYPNNLVALTVTVSKGSDKQIYGLKFRVGEVFREERLYLEFGTAPLASDMSLAFQNGPYDEIKSITTGLTGSNSLTDNVSII